MILNTRILSLCCCCLISIACILYIVSNALPKWGSMKTDSVTSSLGLWSICESNELATFCISTADLCKLGTTKKKLLISCDKQKASQAFMTIACILSGFAALDFLAYIFIKTDSNHIILLMCKILLFVAVIAGIIGVTVGIVSVFDIPEFELKLDAAAIIGIVALVVNAFSAVLSLLIR